MVNFVIHQLAHEPSGDAYRQLMTVLAESQSFFSLVQRRELGFRAEQSDIAIALAPLEVSRAYVKHWPGTELIRHKATVVLYRLTPDAVAPLLVPNALFNWRAPHFPEDLAFYDARKRCTFASVSHEREAWVLDKQLVSALGSIVTLMREEVPDTAFRVIAGAHLCE